MGGVYFDNCNFADSDFKNVFLEGSNIEDSKFSECCLKETVFSKCEFTKTDFSGCDLSGSKFANCSFNGCDLSKADLSNCVFENCTFNGTVMESSKLKDGKFLNCDIKESSLRYSDLDNCSFAGSFISHTDLDGTIFDNYRDSLGITMSTKDFSDEMMSDMVNHVSSSRQKKSPAETKKDIPIKDRLNLGTGNQKSPKAIIKGNISSNSRTMGLLTKQFR